MPPTKPAPSFFRKIFKVLLWIGSIILLSAATLYISMQLSPWPSALFIRYIFNKGGHEANAKIISFVPAHIIAKTDLPYDNSSEITKLDLYYPPAAKDSTQRFPLIVWVHGGGFVAGDKKDLSNYAQILASKGFAVALPNYALAPASKYPIALQQMNAAAAYLMKNAQHLQIDTANLILAGDSGGAHIAAQLSTLTTNSSYAEALNIRPALNRQQLKGVVLYCGPYNAALIDFKNPSWFIRTVLWSYTGNKTISNDDARLKYFSVANFVTEDFPKTFISVGNADPLMQHSHDLARKISAKGVAVDSLFFKPDYRPALPHEYQLDLHTPAGQLALEKTFDFLQRCILIKP